MIKKSLHKKLLQKAGMFPGKKTTISSKTYLFNLLKIFSIILILISISLILYVTDIIGIYGKALPSPEVAFNRSSPESTMIYARDGSLLYTIYDKENRDYIPLNKIPDKMKWAMLSAEDINFYQEAGIDPKGILRAAMYDIFNKGKGNLQGASTITQQLVKYTTLNGSQTIERKIQELILSIKVEKNYSKDQIIEAYLNDVSFGGSIYGIEAASKTYFNKDIWDLDLAQFALLAGLPQAPSIYSPFYGSKPTLGKQRQIYVLNQMLANRNLTKVTEEEIKTAINEPLKYATQNNDITDPHFVFYIRDLLNKKYGSDMVKNAGLKVYTSLDPYDQSIAQAVVTQGVQSALQDGSNAHNGSLVSIDSHTGQVLAMVGSVDYHNTDPEIDGNVNMTTSVISPGSSVKPFTYTLAFEKIGYTPDTIVPDSPITFQGGYAPTDWNNTYEGNIPIKRALLESRNIPAVFTENIVGYQNVYNIFKIIGLNLGPIQNYGLSLTIGGEDVSLVDLSHAYTLFPNDGKLLSLNPILKVYDKYGKLIEDHSQIRFPTTVYTSKYVKMMNSILVNYAAVAPVRKLGYAVAGKTGTSQSNKDLVFIGYSANVVTGVWCGNTNNANTTANSWGETVTAPIWNQYMSQILPRYPKIPLDVTY